MTRPARFFERRIYQVNPAYPLGSDAAALAGGIKWLLNRRQSSGAWGGQEDRFITTCQVITMLLEAGYPPRSAVIAKAVDFISTLPVGERGGQWTYSRLEPLALVGDAYPEEVRELVITELSHLIDRIRQGSSPTQRFVLPLLAIKVIYLLGLQSEMSAEQEMCVQRTLLQWDPESTFHAKPEMASFGLAWLWRVPWPQTASFSQQDVLRTCRSFIMTHREAADGKFSWRSGQISATSFICIDLAELDDSQSIDAPLRRLLKGAWMYLRSQQRRDGHWEPIPNESSTTLSHEYYTAVALRALLAVNRVDRVGIEPHDWVGLVQRTEERVRGARWTAAAAVLALAGAAGNLILQSGVLNRLRPIVTVLVPIAAALAVAVAAAIIGDFARSGIRRLFHRLGMVREPGS